MDWQEEREQNLCHPAEICMFYLQQRAGSRERAADFRHSPGSPSRLTEACLFVAGVATELFFSILLPS